MGAAAVSAARSGPPVPGSVSGDHLGLRARQHAQTAEHRDQGDAAGRAAPRPAAGSGSGAGAGVRVGAGGGHGGRPCRHSRRQRHPAVEEVGRDIPVGVGTPVAARGARGSSGRPPGPRRTGSTSGSAARSRRGRRSRRWSRARPGRGWCVRRTCVGSTPHTSSRRLVKLADVVHGVEQLADTAVGERLALQRDQHAVGGGQRRRRSGPRATAGSPAAPSRRRRRGPRAAILTTCSRPVRVSRSASARASSMVAGSRSTPSSVSRITSAGDEALGQHVVHRELEVLRVDAEGEGQAGLRVEVDEQHPLARARRARLRARRRTSSWPRRPSGWRRRGWWSRGTLCPQGGPVRATPGPWNASSVMPNGPRRRTVRPAPHRAGHRPDRGDRGGLRRRARGTRLRPGARRAGPAAAA